MKLGKRFAQERSCPDLQVKCRENHSRNTGIEDGAGSIGYVSIEKVWPNKTYSQNDAGRQPLSKNDRYRSWFLQYKPQNKYKMIYRLPCKGTGCTDFFFFFLFPSSPWPIQQSFSGRLLSIQACSHRLSGQIAKHKKGCLSIRAKNRKKKGKFKHTCDLHQGKRSPYDFSCSPTSPLLYDVGQ